MRQLETVVLSLLSAGAGHGDARVAVTAHGRCLAWLPRRWRRRERRRKRTRGELGLGPALPWCVRSCVRHLLAAGLELRRRRIRGGRPAGGRSRLSGDLAVRDRMADLFCAAHFTKSLLGWQLGTTLHHRRGSYSCCTYCRYSVCS